MPTQELTKYLRVIEKNLQQGNATEHTHRPALESLIESLSKGVTATNEPKRVACGAPDFIVSRRSTPLGYIETKDVGKSLDAIEADARRARPKTHDGEQLRRYLESLGNLILTNYLEFRWYVRGEHRLSAAPAKPAAKGKLRKQKEGEQPLIELLNAFLSAEAPIIATSKELAGRMAKLARLTRNAIRRAFEDESGGGSLHQQMEGFRKVLLHDLTEEQFADMYAQTIAYGLFTARCHHKGKEPFSREHAPYDLPKTNPFLRKTFAHVAGVELDERIVWREDGSNLIFEDCTIQKMT